MSETKIIAARLSSAQLCEIRAEDEKVERVRNGGWATSAIKHRRELLGHVAWLEERLRDQEAIDAFRAEVLEKHD